MSDDIVWEEPPRPLNVGAQPKWVKHLEPLMKHPKRWAIVRENKSFNTSSSLATDLRKGKLSRPPGQWEFAARRNGKGGKVYARYLGPEDDA